MKFFYLILAIINFLIFAYDIENDRDFFTWIWLLTSILNFIQFLRFELNQFGNANKIDKLYSIEQFGKAIDEAIETWEHKHIKTVIINNLTK